MPVAILTGALTSHDATLGGSSLKCAFAQLSVQISAQPIDTTTFCSSSYVEELKGRIQADFSIVGYTTSGATWSDPTLFVTNSAPVAFVGLAVTGCSISFSANVFSDGMSLSAAFNSGRVISGRSTGSITSVWITT